MTPSSKALAGLCAVLLLLAGCATAPKAKPERPAATETKPVAKPATAAKPVVAPNPAKDANGQFEDALAALKAKNLPEARAGFELLAKEHPEFAGPLTNLGILNAKASAREVAIANFNKAVNANPRNAIAHNWLGILYRESKNYPRAEQSYLQALAINPESAPVVLNLAILYDLYLKRPDNALSRYRDYQRITGNRELKVTAWIKALEGSQTAAQPTAPAPAAQPAPPKT